MTGQEINLTPLEKFKLACIDDVELTDDEVWALIPKLNIVLDSEDDAIEFCAILKKHRPKLAQRFFLEALQRKRH